VFHQQPKLPAQVETKEKPREAQAKVAVSKGKPPAKPVDRSRRQSLMGTRKAEVVVLDNDDDRELGPPEFVELLVRLGNRRFGKVRVGVSLRKPSTPSHFPPQ
jgi:hypothetical protein